MRWFPLLILLSTSLVAAEPDVEVIAYHDVRDNVAADYDADQYAVSTRNLIAHFTWLREAGYQPVSIDQIIAARDGRTPLPDKAVLITFDDGLANMYHRVFPLLKLFSYPAVFSVVSSWIEGDGTVEYGGRTLARRDFLTWEQIREMRESGLVEIASHSHNLHRGVLGNPQGNLQPAAVTRRYLGDGYEDEAEYRARIERDLALSAATIAERSGMDPRVITWPFGAFNDIAAAAARRQGMSISLTLEPSSTEKEGTLHLGRYLVTANPDLGNFSGEITLEDRPPVVRVAQVDLDYVYDEDPAQQKRNLDRLLDRIKALQISHVYLQAFSDLNGDGGAEALYFPNRHLPMRADLFNRVAWQLKTRAYVRVYAWLPMLSFVGDAFDPAWRILEHRDGELAPDDKGEPRLSPFHVEARQRIAEIYEDLAVHARFDGLLFHDDGRLSEFEDFSVAAMAAYEREFESAITPQLLARNAELRRRFGTLKVQTLLDFGKELEERVRAHLPAIRTARSLFASALLDPEAPAYLAQDYDAFLGVYDYVALMAMPYLEGAEDEEEFYLRLIDAVAAREEGLPRTIFQLQTVDWSQRERIAASSLYRRFRWLQSHGVRNLGYYPDDFIGGHPDLEALRLGMSLADNPGWRYR